MKQSPRGAAFTKGFETLALREYDDEGHPAIGYGHQMRPGEPATITEGQADAYYATDIRVYESAVNSCVHVPLTQEQFDALVDFAYNEGAGALARSTLVRLLNEGNFELAEEHFEEWDKDIQGGVLAVDPGLRRRRLAELAMFKGAAA